MSEAAAVETYLEDGILLVELNRPERRNALDEALQNLAVDEADAAKLVELCIFAGCSVEDAGKIMGWSRPTSYRNWTYARAFLTRQLGAE